MSEARTLYDRWDTLSTDEKQQIVDEITEKIEIGKEEVSITLYYKPSPDVPPRPQGSGPRIKRLQQIWNPHYSFIFQQKR